MRTDKTTTQERLLIILVVMMFWVVVFFCIAVSGASAATTGLVQPTGGYFTAQDEQMIASADRTTIYGDYTAHLENVSFVYKNTGTGTCHASAGLHIYAWHGAEGLVSDTRPHSDADNLTTGETRVFTFDWTANTHDLSVLTSYSSYDPYVGDPHNFNTGIGGTCSIQIEYAHSNEIGTNASTKLLNQGSDYDAKMAINVPDWDGEAGQLVYVNIPVDGAFYDRGIIGYNFVSDYPVEGHEFETNTWWSWNVEKLIEDSWTDVLTVGGDEVEGYATQSEVACPNLVPDDCWGADGYHLGYTFGDGEYRIRAAVKFSGHNWSDWSGWNEFTVNEAGYEIPDPDTDPQGFWEGLATALFIPDRNEYGSIANDLKASMLNKYPFVVVGEVKEGIEAALEETEDYSTIVNVSMGSGANLTVNLFDKDDDFIKTVREGVAPFVSAIVWVMVALILIVSGVKLAGKI